MSDTSSAKITAGGNRMLTFLDGLPVEQDWIAGHHIVWQTGQQNGPDGEGPEGHTHCSAFAAAAALDLDIYLLRPPSHSQELLANAQVAWLRGVATYPGPTAADSGWRSLGTTGDHGALDAAVAAANAGKLVFAGYRQPPVTDPVTGTSHAKPGHVVLVRPQSTIEAGDGPLVTMAGDRNWREIHMRQAFSSHAGAWPNDIYVFVHDTDLEAEFVAGQGAA